MVLQRMGAGECSRRMLASFAAVRLQALAATSAALLALAAAPPAAAMVVIDNTWNGTRPVVPHGFTLPSGVNFGTGPEPLGYTISRLDLYLLAAQQAIPRYRLALATVNGAYGHQLGPTLAEVDLKMYPYSQYHWSFDSIGLGAIASVDLEPLTYYNLSLYPDPATIWPHVSGWIYEIGPYDAFAGFVAPMVYGEFGNAEGPSPRYRLSVEPILAPAPVPAPLPLLVVPVAFGCTRRLRRRLRSPSRGPASASALPHAR